MGFFIFPRKSVIPLVLAMYLGLVILTGCSSTFTETRGEEGRCIGFGRRYLVGPPSQCENLKED